MRERRSEKLWDLLKEKEKKEEEEGEEMAELKRVVKELEGEDSTKRRMAATKVRLLAKEGSEVRGKLAMLGAIPPLVRMLDHSESLDSQIASLYALLNLAIANDASVFFLFRFFNSFSFFFFPIFNPCFLLQLFGVVFYSHSVFSFPFFV